MGSSSGLRQRKDHGSKAHHSAPANKKNAPVVTRREKRAQAAPAPRKVTKYDDETSAYQIIRNHWATPIFIITAVILGPYRLWEQAQWLILQKPHVITQLTGIQLRPAVALNETRPLLIVGTMSGGTTQVAADLVHYFQWEVGHESSDSTTAKVRDGTVSWFHGVRFLPRPGTADADLTLAMWMQSILKICTNFTPNVGFHPRMYKSANCSTGPFSTTSAAWSACWRRECVALLHAEWGCAWTSACETPFRRTLHQVRHPLRTMESLVTKLCVGGLNGTVHAGLQRLFSALFPLPPAASTRKRNEKDQTTDSSWWDTLSCIETAGYYVASYQRAMLKASAASLIYAKYAVERTSPCDVARLAGFVVNDTTAAATGIYPPSQARASLLCQQNMSDDAKPPAYLQPMISTTYQVNQGQVQLTWEDLMGGKHGSQRSPQDRRLYDEIYQLTQDLGYNTTEG
jgi:hypothetical protein